MKNIMLSLIKSEIFGSEFKQKSEFTEKELASLYSESNKQDMAHIVASALQRLGIDSGEKFKKSLLLALLRREQQNIELQRICSVLTESKIDYIVLKGSYIKSLYPKDWMRTSCDIDILIRESDLKDAIAQITERLCYNQESDGSKDCSLVAKNGVNLELHFSLCGGYEGDKYLKNVWTYAIKDESNEYSHTLSPEFFLFYHIAHMAVHMNEGGCGIRPFVDFKLFTDNIAFDESVIKKMLADCRYDRFYNGVKNLSAVWFDDSPHSEETLLFEEYVISGGVYGTRENLGAVGKRKDGSFFGYLVKRIFMPKEKLRLVYPKIDKYPILIPYYQVKRWFKLTNKSTYQSAKNELSGSKNAELTSKLFDSLGL